MGIERLCQIWNNEWQVTKKLGEGGYGQVYEIVRHDQHGLKSISAVKVVSIPKTDAEVQSLYSEGNNSVSIQSYFYNAVTSFTQEIALMQGLKAKSNIVSIEDYKVLQKTDTIGWDIFIRMERLTPLNEYLAGRLLPESGVIRLGYELCTALELCAQRNIIHRDIKPENIFVSPDGDIKLGDFGIARELEKSNRTMSRNMGTYEYMAPEVRTSQYNKTVDIYSLGVVLYKLLNNNRLPFVDPNARHIPSIEERHAALTRRFNGEQLPPPANASPRIAEVILAACAFNPHERIQTPSAFMNALTAGASLPPALLKPKPFETTMAQPHPHAHGHTTAQQSQTFNAHNGMPPPQVPLQGNTTHRIANPLPQAPHPSYSAPPVKNVNKTKKSGAGKWIAAVAILVLISGGVIGLFVLNPGGIRNSITGDPAASVIGFLRDGDFDMAEYHAPNVDSDALFTSMESHLVALEADFRAERIEFSDAMLEIDSIVRMNIPGLSGTHDSTRNNINNLNASRIAFNTAEALYERSDYPTAIAQFRQVISDDTNYNNARDGINRAINAHRSNVLVVAQNYSSGGYYPRAIRVLEDALLVIEHDPDITQQLNVYNAAYTSASRQRILNTAADFTDSNDWPNAITTLSNALRDMPGDSLIEERLRSYEQAYVASAISEADMLVMQGGYDAAIAVLNRVLVTLPGNVQISEQISMIGDIRPISLASLVVIDSRSYAHSVNLFIDSFGNHHHESFEFVPRVSNHGREYSNSNSASYAVFNLGRNFETFTANVVAPVGTNSDASFSIEVTFDNNPTPVTFVSGFNVTTGETLIDVAVVGVEIMTITTRVRGIEGRTGTNVNGSSHQVRLVDAILTR